MGNIINKITNLLSRKDTNKNINNEVHHQYNPIYLSQDAEQCLLDNGYALVNRVWIYVETTTPYINTDPINDPLYDSDVDHVYGSDVFSDTVQD